MRSISYQRNHSSPEKIGIPVCRSGIHHYVGSPMDIHILPRRLYRVRVQGNGQNEDIIKDEIRRALKDIGLDAKLFLGQGSLFQVNFRGKGAEDESEMIRETIQKAIAWSGYAVRDITSQLD